ncbi:unnamed protein product [Schistosoma curassoni]|uniref:Ovule protein n=1 Tax=Schistosoma curassoni TaxID=6186 RepID=A0A183KUF1_9TREM|nr:unnamed protein product [Schistosoma curassoni]
MILTGKPFPLDSAFRQITRSTTLARICSKSIWIEDKSSKGNSLHPATFMSVGYNDSRSSKPCLLKQKSHEGCVLLIFFFPIYRLTDILQEI